jgi:hypothetical protein
MFAFVVSDELVTLKPVISMMDDIHMYSIPAD